MNSAAERRQWCRRERPLQDHANRNIAAPIVADGIPGVGVPDDQLMALAGNATAVSRRHCRWQNQQPMAAGERGPICHGWGKFSARSRLPSNSKRLCLQAGAPARLINRRCLRHPHCQRPRWSKGDESGKAPSDGQPRLNGLGRSCRSGRSLGVRVVEPSRAIRGPEAEAVAGDQEMLCV